MVKTKLLHSVGSVLGTLLFVLALWVLHTELKTYHLHDIVNRTGHFLPIVFFSPFCSPCSVISL